MTDMTNQNEKSSAKQAPRTARRSPPLRILLASQVGSVGKSMVAVNVLLPRLGRETVYAIDALDGSHYGAWFREYSTEELIDLHHDVVMDRLPAVVDLAASDYASFVRKLYSANILKIFSYCVLVSGTDEKAQVGAIRTYQTLRNFGMDSSKFRIVLNRVREPNKIATPEKMDGLVKDQFPILFSYAAQDPDFWINPRCYIPVLDDCFTQLMYRRTSIAQVLADKTDYEALQLDSLFSGDDEGARKAADLMLCAAFAQSAAVFFGKAFEALSL